MTVTTSHAARDPIVTTGWATALAGWELELRAADRPSNTRCIRPYHLRRLADDFQGRDICAMTRTEMVEWLARWLDWSRETRRSYRYSIRVFYRWGVAAGHVAVSPAGTLPPITSERGLPRPVPSERLMAAVAAADPRGYGWRCCCSRRPGCAGQSWPRCTPTISCRMRTGGRCKGYMEECRDGTVSKSGGIKVRVPSTAGTSD